MLSMKKTRGDYYDVTSDWQHAKWLELLGLIKKEITSCSAILDVGCGSGKRTIALKDELAAEYVAGIDPDIKMIEVAKKKYASSNAEFFCHPAHHVNRLKRQKFDCIQANYSLHWVAEKEKFFKRIQPYCHDNTLLAIGTCERLPQIFVDVDNKVRSILPEAEKAASPFHYLTLPEWEELLARFGWKVTSCLKKTEPHITEDADAFLQHWLSASTEKVIYGEKLETIDFVKLQCLVDEMLEKYRLPKSDRLKFNEDTLILTARKVL